MLMSNIAVCPHCNSQNISTMYDDRRRVVRVMCGNCREFTDYDMDEVCDDKNIKTR